MNKEQYIDQTISDGVREAVKQYPFGEERPTKQSIQRSPGYHVHRHLLGAVHDLQKHLKRVDAEAAADGKSGAADLDNLQEKFDALADVLETIAGSLSLEAFERSEVKNGIKRLREPLPSAQPAADHGVMFGTPLATKPLTFTELRIAAKKEPGRIFETRRQGLTHETFWDAERQTMMHRIVGVSHNHFEPTTSLVLAYTRTDRVFVGNVLGHDVTAKPPLSRR